MPEVKIDWFLVRTEYEQGASKQALSFKYGVSRQAILKRARKEHWITPLVPSPDTPVPSPGTTLFGETTDEVSELSRVEKVKLLIFQRLDEQPEDKNIKLLVDSLHQLYKMKVLIPEQQSEGGQEAYGMYDMREFLAGCTDEELAMVRPVIAAVQARKQAMEEEKVKPLRRIG